MSLKRLMNRPTTHKRAYNGHFMRLFQLFKYNLLFCLHPTRLRMKSVSDFSKRLYIINSISINTRYTIYNLIAFKTHLSVFENRGLAD